MARKTQFVVSVFVKNTIYCGFWWIYLPLRRGLLYPFNYAGVLFNCDAWVRKRCAAALRPSPLIFYLNPCAAAMYYTK